MKGRKKISLGAVVVAFVYLLLGSTLSWGDVMYVNKAANGDLTITLFDDSTGLLGAPVDQGTTTLRKSCIAPDFFWDAGIAAFRLRGYDDSHTPKWSAQVDTSGIASNFLPVTQTDFTSCNGGTAEQLSAEIPSLCTTYEWSQCTNGVTTATVSPQGCTPDQPTSLSCGSLRECTYSYNPSAWPSSCTPGTLQTRTATANNSPCLPVPADTMRICPASAPSAPTNVAAAPGNASATVSFSQPLDGGSPITSYTVTSTGGGKTASGSGSPITVTGLINDVRYAFTVKATNAMGTGPASAASNVVIPTSGPTVPGVPTNVSATAGDASATVSFTAPSNGGSPITSYTVTSTPGSITASGSGSPITVTGLTNNTAYTFKVKATNAVGTGSESAASNSVTPTGGTDPAGTITMSASTEYRVTLDANNAKYFKFALPSGCSSSPYKVLMVNLITSDVSAGAGQGQILVKSSNQRASTWPTVADFTYEFAAHGYSYGQDWTRDTNGGVFFYNFVKINPDSSTPVLNSYTGHTSFSQADTYYGLLYNQGPLSNEYRLSYFCY